MSWEVSFRRLFYRGCISGKMFLGDVLLQYLERPHGAARLCSTTVSDLNGKFTPNKLNSKSELNKTSSHWHSSTTTSRSAFLTCAHWGKTRHRPWDSSLHPQLPDTFSSFSCYPPEQPGWRFTSRHWNILKLSKCRKRGFLCVESAAMCTNAQLNLF